MGPAVRIDARRVVRGCRVWAERSGLEVHADEGRLSRARDGVRHDVLISTQKARGMRGASLAITEVSVVLGIRVEAVEAVLDETFAGSPRHRPMVSTVARSLDSVVARATPRRLAGEADLDDVCARIADDLERAGLPWLEAHEGLAAIERLLAEDPRTIDAVMRGWVLASMRGTLAEARGASSSFVTALPRFWREDFEKLADRLARAPVDPRG